MVELNTLDTSPRVIRITALPGNELTRLAEIDRSEQVSQGYRMVGGALVAEDVDWRIPDWAHTGDSEHSVATMVATWQPSVDAGGQLLGALDGERLAGLALLRPHLRPGLAQLALLFVSRPYRRQGVAAQLLAEVVGQARALGATALYVSATPSASAVGFYLAQGFVPTVEPIPELFAKEPEDIHLLKPLA